MADRNNVYGGVPGPNNPLTIEALTGELGWDTHVTLK